MPLSTRIVRSARRRRTVALRVLDDGTLTVQAPLRTSLAWIERFLKSRADWIAKRRAEARQASLARPFILSDGSSLPYLGETLTLALAQGTYAPPLLRWDDRYLRLTFPPELSGPELQAEIRTELILWYKKQARGVFQERFARRAEEMGLSTGRLILSAPTRRWGSCNAKNDVRLNWRLIMGQPAWLDYVIVHELAHIPHKNHGPSFWRCVARLLPEYKTTRRELRAWKGEGWLDPFDTSLSRALT